jgi:hypothetical protein
MFSRINKKLFGHDADDFRGRFDKIENLLIGNRRAGPCKPAGFLVNQGGLDTNQGLVDSCGNRKDGRSGGTTSRRRGRIGSCKGFLTVDRGTCPRMSHPFDSSLRVSSVRRRRPCQRRARSPTSRRGRLRQGYRHSPVRGPDRVLATDDPTSPSVAGPSSTPRDPSWSRRRPVRPARRS